MKVTDSMGWQCEVKGIEGVSLLIVIVLLSDCIARAWGLEHDHHES